MRLRLTPEELKEYRQRARTSPWLAYPLTAVPKVLPWHESRAHYRVLAGPNGGGKSTAGAADFVSYALGYNPIRRETYNVPNVCWAVCVEYNSAGRVMQRKISDMLPRKPSGSPAWKWYKQEHVFELENGSVIQIKSQKEGESSLLAERCRAIWVDEAMGGERGLENFGELQARGLPDEPLDMLFTLTPKMDTGLEWMRRKLWKEPNETAHEDWIAGTYCLRFELSDCLIENGGFLTPEYVADKEAKVDPMEREARILGLWTPFITRPAFSYGLLLRALERAPESRPVRFRSTSFNRHVMEATDGTSPCRVQRERETAHNYILAWDPSSGLGKGHDYSACSVFDRADLCQVFYAKADNIGPDAFYRDIVLPAARHYNDALLIIENNGQGGGAAINAAVSSEYHNLYMQKNLGRSSGTYTDKYGWTTSEQSRHRVIDAMKRALTEDKWTPSRELVEEMGHMIGRRIGDRVKVMHSDGYHDDLAMAAGIALAVHYEEPVIEWPDFNLLKVRWGHNQSRTELPLVGGPI
jgi:hypothetical protein